MTSHFSAVTKAFPGTVAWGWIGGVMTLAPLSRYALKMDISKMLSDLRSERDQISEAIVVLERLSVGQGKRRGRPPKWLTEVKRRGRPKGSKNKSKSN